MFTYLAAAARFQSECPSPAERLAAWLRRRTEARHRRRAARRNRRILSRLDRRMLADIGVAAGSEAEIAGFAAGLSVQALVANTLADRLARP